MSRPTLSELKWPMDEESHRQAEDWAASISTQALDWTWRGFDLLSKNLISKVDLTQSFDQLERDLTRHHFTEIQILWAKETGGECAFSPHHEYPELETRSPAPAKPPAYDIAFVWNENRRVALPIEAKVVATPRSIAQYMTDTEKFVSGTAAPLVADGAQIAYLLTGNFSEFFVNLTSGLSTSLEPVSGLDQRPHNASHHTRSASPGLTLHHMVMYCGNPRDVLE